jgi:hypothetical protein
VAWLPKGDDPSILVTDGGTIQWSHGTDTTGKGAVLWIDPNGVFGWGQSYHALLDNAWHYDTADTIPTKGAMVYMTADPPEGLWDVLDIGSDQSLLHVNEGIPAWKAKGNDESLLATRGGSLTWFDKGNNGSLLATLGGALAWFDKGQANQPLRSTADGLEWYDGPSDTVTMVTDVRVNGLSFEKKTRTLTITKGLVTSIGAESGWTAFHTGTECPEE